MWSGLPAVLRSFAVDVDVVGTKVRSLHALAFVGKLAFLSDFEQEADAVKRPLVLFAVVAHHDVVRSCWVVALLGAQRWRYNIRQRTQWHGDEVGLALAGLILLHLLLEQLPHCFRPIVGIVGTACAVLAFLLDLRHGWINDNCCFGYILELAIGEIGCFGSDYLCMFCLPKIGARGENIRVRAPSRPVSLDLGQSYVGRDPFAGVGASQEVYWRQHNLVRGTSSSFALDFLRATERTIPMRDSVAGCPR